MGKKKRNTGKQEPKVIQAMKEERKERRDYARSRTVAMTVVYFLLRLSVVGVMIAQFFNGDYENVFLCALTLILFLMPELLERKLHIEFPNVLTVVVLLFIYSAEILGEIRAFYISFPYWDTMLHTLNGFLCAAIGFSLVDLLNEHKRFSIHMSPLFMAVVAFCFSMTIGVIWEFIEFSVDHVLLMDCQKDTIIHTLSTVELNPDHLNKVVIVKDITDVILVQSDGTQIPLGLGGYLDIGLIDTIKDMFVNLIGAVVFSVVGFFYVKYRGRGKLAPMFIPKVIPADKLEEDKTPPEPEQKPETNE